MKTSDQMKKEMKRMSQQAFDQCHQEITDGPNSAVNFFTQPQPQPSPNEAGEKKATEWELTEFDPMTNKNRLYRFTTFEEGEAYFAQWSRTRPNLIYALAQRDIYTRVVTTLILPAK
jgi:hypothetical protein